MSTFSATLGAMAIGTILGWTSPAQVALPKQHPFEFPVSEQEAYAYGPAFGLGAVLGALPAGAVSGVIGPRRTMLLCQLFVITGWISLTVPAAAWMLTAGRTLQGIGAGALCTVIPAYVGEISQPNVRGMYTKNDDDALKF